MSERTLDDLVDDLVLPVITTIQREIWKDGRRTGSRPEYVTSPPLLEQLRAAIFQGMEGGTRGAFESKLPLASNALDVWNAIEQEAYALYVGQASHVTAVGKEIGLLGAFWDYPDGEDSDPQPTDLTADVVRVFSTTRPRVAPLDLVDTIRGWVASVQTDEQAHVAGRVLRRWHAQILALLRPEAVIDLPGTCPRSGVEWVIERGKRKTALYVAYGAEGLPEVHSRATGDVWCTAAELREIGFHIGATVDEAAMRALGLTG